MDFAQEMSVLGQKDGDLTAIVTIFVRENGDTIWLMGLGVHYFQTNPCVERNRSEAFDMINWCWKQNDNNNGNNGSKGKSKKDKKNNKNKKNKKKTRARTGTHNKDNNNNTV